GSYEKDRGKDTERVERKVPSRRAQLVGNDLSQYAPFDGRGIGLQRNAKQSGVRLLVRTEGNDALDTRRSGGSRKPVKLGIVTIEYGSPAGLDACEDFSLGIGDLFQRPEIFEVHRFNAGNNCHAGTDDGGKRRDLARVVHADLEHGVFRTGRT